MSRRLHGRLCPACGKSFKTEHTLLQHINQPLGNCSALQHDFETLAPHRNSETHSETDDDDPMDDPMMDEGPFDDAEVDNDNTEAAPNASEKHQYFYPDAGQTYGNAPSFMDLFNTDQHSNERLENPYWPFASKADWGMGSWLLRSGLSMRAIDDFLVLEKV